MSAEGISIERVGDLSAPFDPADVHWRAQKVFERDGNHSALALAYIDARNVMDRLDEICGPANWQDRYEETPKGRVICTLSINIGGYWVNKSDGAGDTDVEGEKGAVSDALKRAAVKWGIGRYLYGMGNTYVPCTVTSNGKFGKFTVDPWTCVKASPALITTDQRDLLMLLTQAAGVTLQTILDGYGIRDLRELPADKFGKARARLDQIIAENKKEAA